MVGFYLYSTVAQNSEDGVGWSEFLLHRFGS